jgi:TonB family protein
MNRFAGLALSCLANSVWEAALIAAAGYLVSRLVKRLGPRFEHRVWVATLISSVITPVLPLLRELFSSIDPEAPGPHVATIFIASQNSLQGSRPAFALPQAVIWSLLAIYSATILYFGGRLIYSLRGAATLLRNAGPASLTPEQDQIWRGCKRSFSLDRAQLLSSPVSGPVALGLRSPILLLPSDFPASCTPQDFLAAVAHECAHLNRRDFQKNLFYEAIGLPLAFHPAIWAIKAQIAQTREMICDATVMERQMDGRSYSRSLLRLATMVAVATRVPTIHPIGIFDANILEKRIMRISVKKYQASVLLKFALLFPAALILVSAALAGAAMAVVIEPLSQSQNAVQSSPYGPVYKVGKDVSAPVVLKSIEAKFPKSARRAQAGFQAVVLVHLIVDAEGMPRDVQISRSYNADFDEEAVKAIQLYRFKPAMRDGKPVAVEVNIEVNFKKY